MSTRPRVMSESCDPRSRPPAGNAYPSPPASATLGGGSARAPLERSSRNAANARRASQTGAESQRSWLVIVDAKDLSSVRIADPSVPDVVGGRAVRAAGSGLTLQERELSLVVYARDDRAATRATGQVQVPKRGAVADNVDGRASFESRENAPVVGDVEHRGRAFAASRKQPSLC